MSSFDISSVTAVAFDLDGTIYLGNSVVDGAAELVFYLKEKGISVFYFTNGSSRTRLQVKEKLAGMGLNTSISRIYTSAYATAKYVADSGLGCVYCIGSKGLRDELEGLGVQVTDDAVMAEALVVGLDIQFSYQRLSSIMPFKGDGRPIFVCNRDNNYPVEGMKFMPGCGPIVAAIENALERGVTAVIGKPNTLMMELLCKDWNLYCSEIAIVGDSVPSDIQMAINCRCLSFLVAGNGRFPDVETVVVKDILDIRYFFEGKTVPSNR